MKPAAQRVRELRERRKLEGLRRVEFWLDECTEVKMRAYLEALTEARSNSPESDNDSSHTAE